MCPRRSAFKPEDAGDQVDMLGGSSVDRGWWGVVNQSKGSKSIQGTYKVSQKYFPKLTAFMRLNQAQMAIHMIQKTKMAKSDKEWPKQQEMSELTHQAPNDRRDHCQK